MAKGDTPEVSKNGSTPDDSWEDIKVGLGREWDLEHDGALVGIFRGSEGIEVEDKQNGGTRITMAYSIETEQGDDPNRFIWGSYNIDKAFEQVNVGDTVRVQYLGVDTFTGDKGPQSIKTYRVQRRVGPATA